MAETFQQVESDRSEARLEIYRLRQENSKLRKILAESNLPCVYCNLPKVDMSKCSSGFPGCGRADDIQWER